MMEKKELDEICFRVAIKPTSFCCILMLTRRSFKVQGLQSGNLNGPHNDANGQQPKKTMCLEDIIYLISLSFGAAEMCHFDMGGGDKHFFRPNLRRQVVQYLQAAGTSNPCPVPWVRWNEVGNHG